MRRQFLRVYLGIALVLLLSAAATLFMVDREVRRAVDQRVEEDMASWLGRLRARLADAEDAQQRARVLERLSEFAPFAVRVEPLAGLRLSETDSRRLAEGESVSVVSDSGRMVYGGLEDGQVIVLGPMQKGRWAGRRGPHGLPPPLPRMESPPPGFDEPIPPPEGLLPPEELPPRPLGPRLAGEGPPPFAAFPFQGSYLVLVGLLAVLVVIGAAVFLLLRPFERRIYALADVARRFGEGQLEVRAPAGGDDAIGVLGRAFDHMAVRIGSLIAQQQELLRAVSHELRTPLARLFFLVDDAQGAHGPEAKEQYLQRIEGSLQDLDALVVELLTFVRLDGGAEAFAGETLALRPVLADAAAAVGDLRPGMTVELDGDDLQVVAVPRLLRRAVLNLATNAARHARQRIRLGIARHGDEVWVVADDDGPGVPAGARERIFEPFCRLDESRTPQAGGAGLGLAIVRRIMELHGGKASVEDSPLGGARFTLAFPAGSPEAQ